MENPLRALMAFVTGGQAAQSLVDRPAAGPNQAVATGRGAMVKRYGTLEWVPLESSGGINPNDLVRFPEGGELATPGGAPLQVRPGSLMVYDQGSWMPADGGSALKGLPVVSGTADFRPRR